MIPRVASVGTSFSGAGLYYLNDKREDQQVAAERPSAEAYHLHDKRGAESANRVGFTATRNLPTTDPQKAVRCMSWLASNAHAVRQAAVAAAARAAGMSYDAYVRAHNPYRGRKGKKPVYTMSIAWHPTRNKAPSKTQMLAAADQVLKELGLTDHQALIVQHTDTKHPHVHLIVNRVHPTTGLYASLGNDRLKLSRWALEFERRTGLIVCPERVEAWQRRDAARVAKVEARATDPKAKGTYVTARNVPRRDHDWFKSVAHLPPDQIRQARAARQEREREQLRGIAGRRSRHVERQIEKHFVEPMRRLENEISWLWSQEGWRKHRDSNLVALILSPRHAVQSLIDVFTARAYLRQRKIKAVDHDIRVLRRVIDTTRQDERDRQNTAVSRMQQRHRAERRRDEERIEALARARRGKGTTEKGRFKFNLRGDAETARYVPAGKALVTLSDVHAKVVRGADRARARVTSALGDILESFGFRADARELKTSSLTNVMLSPAAPAAPAPTPPAPLPPEKSATSEGLAKVPNARGTGDERAAFEARRDAVLARIDTEQQEKRRRRKRPRGKVRRME